MVSYIAVPYAAQLRVYQPLAVFTPAEQQSWRSHSRTRQATWAATVAEHRQHLRGLVAIPPVIVPEQESTEAFVLTIDGTTYACPWHTRLRSWEALTEFSRSFPDSLQHAFIPPQVVQQLQTDYHHWRGEHPDQYSHIRTSSWIIPPAWFAAFDPAEREIRLRVPRSLHYRTRMSAARRRLARALRTLRETLESPRWQPVEDLAQWLEHFHPRSFVELDYGGLVHTRQAASVAEDTSVADVHTMLARLSEGNRPDAERAYRRLTQRWMHMQLLERAN